MHASLLIPDALQIVSGYNDVEAVPPEETCQFSRQSSLNSEVALDGLRRTKVASDKKVQLQLQCYCTQAGI
jgi:hypothetical protein